MRKQDYNGAQPQDPDADRLNAAWNEITAGRAPSYDNGPAELIAAAELLHAEAPDAQPNPNFKTDLREKLMHTAIPIQASRMAPLKRAQDRPMTIPTDPGTSSQIPESLQKGAVHWMAIAATVVLLLTTAVGAYLGGIGRPNNEPSGTNIAAPFVGTPESSGTPVADPCLASVGPYIPCGGDPTVGQGLVVLANLSAESRAASTVQMQGWELDGGESVLFSPPSNPLAGVGVDIVVSGAYQTKFSAPTVVSRPTPGGGSTFFYPDANTPVELVRGDSVTYVLGTKQELMNPLDSTMLQFKSVLIYKGDPTPENLVAEGNYRSRLDGDVVAELPMPLGEYETPEVSIIVTYVQPIPGYPFPPDDSSFTAYVLGPVASTRTGGGPGEGFVVWVSTPPG